MELEDYINALKDADAPIKKLKNDLNKKVKKLILKTFDAETNPYGVSWQPLIYRPTPPPMLNLTGDGRRSLQVNTTDAGVTAVFTKPYMRFHQTGTKYMVARKILPTGLWPTRWVEEIENHWFEAFAQYWSGK